MTAKYRMINGASLRRCRESRSRFSLIMHCLSVFRRGYNRGKCFRSNFAPRSRPMTTATDWNRIFNGADGFFIWLLADAPASNFIVIFANGG